MKKFLIPLLAATIVCSCTKDLENKVGNLENKVTEIENLVADNAAAIKKLQDAAAKAVTITSVVKTDKGYTVNFSDGTVAEIKNGDKGDPGDKGQDSPLVSIVENDVEFVFTFKEDVITIPKDNAFAIKIDVDAAQITEDETVVVNYTLIGSDNTTHVFVDSANGLAAIVDEAASTVTLKYDVTQTVGGPLYAVIKAVRNSDGRYSAQYVSIKLDLYGTFGGLIASDNKEYINW